MDDEEDEAVGGLAVRVWIGRRDGVKASGR